MSHNAQAIALSCIDFRFRKAVQDFLNNELGLPDVDFKGDAGAVQQIVEKTPAGDWICKNFEIAFSLHGVNKIILINHQDCGAYGGSKKFTDEKQEIEFHTEQLKKAVEILKEKYPDKTVEAYFALLSGPIKFEKVV